MRAFLIGLAATTLAAPAAFAQPASLNPDVAAQFAAARAGASAVAPTLEIAAERFRAGMVLNPQAFLAAQSPSEQAQVAAGLGQIGEREATHVSWYFRAAIAHVVVPGRGAVLYYNPLVDIAVFTTWQRVDGVWRLTSARPIDGAALRPDGGYWIDSADSAYRDALAVRARSSLAARGELRDPANPAFPLLRSRSSSLQAGLAAWRADRARAAASEAVRRSLAAAANPAPEGPTREQLQALSPDIRRTLALTAVFRRGDGVSLAYVSPLQPGLLIFVDLDAGLRPVRTGPVNLANLQS
jgi:hypothetical protein